MMQRFLGKAASYRTSSLLKTPPYVTACPEVTSTHIDTDGDSFVVLASDGLWEMLTNDQVVQLVGRWLDHSRGNSNPVTPSFMRRVTGWLWPRGGYEPVTETLDTQVMRQGDWSSALGQKVPDTIPKVRATFRDGNAATHLIRHALGGANEEQVAALLSLNYPLSRRYRDDLTVTVIFFGKNEHFIPRRAETQPVPHADYLNQATAKPQLETLQKEEQ